MENMQSVRSLTPHFPTYAEARYFIKILDGVSIQDYRDMIKEIEEHHGSPQAQSDWLNPDAWIPKRLTGSNRELAFRLWNESKGIVNPRHSRGCWYFCQNHKLLAKDPSEILHLTSEGKQFLNETTDETTAKIDSYEGVLTILQISQEQKAQKFVHLLPAFAVFCRQYTPYKSQNSITSALRYRLANLVDRSYLRHSGQSYIITKEGKDYLDQFQKFLPQLTFAAPGENETELEAPIEELQENNQVRSLTPGLPIYREAGHFLRILDGVPYTLYRNTYNEIWEQRGSPQKQMDWADPDEWIPDRLSGDEAAFALRMWRESKRELNPRYMRGNWYLTTKHNLLHQGNDGKMHITERGIQFLEEPEGKVVADIDEYEGNLVILRLVAERGPGRRSDFLGEYAEFCRQFTGYKSDTPIRSSLYDRLVNLIDRGFVERSGQNYEITEAGLQYLEKYAHLATGATKKEQNQQADLRRLARNMQKESRNQLAEYLSKMDPFKFEYLIKFLLEEIGYRNVQVTSATNDKGVDVVADIDLGISSVREVVQVKRHKSNIGRKILDQLRGSLHRFNAMRGTIITTGGFSSGTVKAAFEAGAAPITLIDGEKLLDLLIENNIGVTKQKIEYLEFDATKLDQFESVEAEEPEV